MAHSARTNRNSATISQGKKFEETARAIGCDEDEAAFKDRLKKLIAAPVKKAPEKPKTKKPSK